MALETNLARKTELFFLVSFSEPEIADKFDQMWINPTSITLNEFLGHGELLGVLSCCLPHILTKLFNLVSHKFIPVTCMYSVYSVAPGNFALVWSAVLKEAKAARDVAIKMVKGELCIHSPCCRQKHCGKQVASTNQKQTLFL